MESEEVNIVSTIPMLPLKIVDSKAVQHFIRYLIGAEIIETTLLFKWKLKKHTIVSVVYLEYVSSPN